MRWVLAQLVLVGMIAHLPSDSRAQSLPPNFAGSYLAIPPLGDQYFTTTLQSRDSKATSVVGLTLQIGWDQIQTSDGFTFNKLDQALNYISKYRATQAVAVTFFCGAACNQLDPPVGQPGNWPIVGAACVRGAQADFRDPNYQQAFRAAEQSVARHIQSNFNTVWTRIVSVALDPITGKDAETGLGLNPSCVDSWASAGLTVDQVVSAQRQAVEWVLADWPSTVVPVEVFYPQESEWANLSGAMPSVTRQLIADFVSTLGVSRMGAVQVDNLAAPRSGINPPMWMLDSVTSGVAGIGESVSFDSPCTDNMNNPPLQGMPAYCIRNDIGCMFNAWEAVPVTQFQLGQATIEAAVFGVYPNGMTDLPVPLPPLPAQCQ